MSFDTKLLSSLRVLYVEDDKNTREEVAFFLEGYTPNIYLASNGREGLELYHAHAPDLIITDIQMPIMTGIEMIRTIRQSDRNVPIFITTAYNETDFLLNALNSGVDRYLLKPLNFTALTDALAETVQSRLNRQFYVTVDQEGMIIDANDAWFHLVGCNRADIIGRPLAICVDPEQKEQLENYLNQIRAGNSPRKQTVTLMQNNGHSTEAVLYAAHVQSGADGQNTYQIEMKNLDSYIYDEELLHKKLELERFTRALIKIQSLIHKSIAARYESDAFLQNIVNLFTGNMHFEFAFICTKENGTTISVTAQGDHERLDIQNRFLHLLDTSSPSCPIKEVIDQHKPVVIEDLNIFNDFPSKTYWTDHNIRSMILLPIHRQTDGQKTPFHVLVLMSSKFYRLDPEILELFENISESVSMGLKTIDDRTEREALQVQLRQERDFMNGILQTAGNIVAVIDRYGSIVRFNKTAEDVTGYTFDEVAFKPFFWKKFLLAEDQADIEHIFASALQTEIIPRHENYWISKTGEKRLFDWTNTILANEAGETEYLIAIGNDITDRKKNEELIEHLAFYDPLTQLANRWLLGNHLSKAMAMSKRSDRYGAILFLDLDNFKPLNDTYGHRFGDLLLIQAADRIQNSVRECDTVARFGGDEFVVLLRELSENSDESMQDAISVAEKIRNALAMSYTLTTTSDGGDDMTVVHQCTSSIGIALFYKTQVSQDDVLRWADKAMYEAKDAGRNRIAFHKDF